MKTLLILLIALFTHHAAVADTNDLEASYAGIGTVISTNEYIQIVKVAIGSPADAAGLHSFDKILRINDIDTKSMALETAISLITGQEGTVVRLAIQGATNGAIRVVSLTRQVFADPSQMEWRDEVLTTMPLEGSTNVYRSISEQ